MLPLIVCRITREAQGVVSLLLRDKDGANLPAFKAGAHIDVDLGNGMVRQYSLIGDPSQCKEYRLGVGLAANSRGGSRRIHDTLREGDTLHIGAPRQLFGLHAQARSHVFIAGGIGITPFLSMIQTCERRAEPWALLYCARSRGHAAFLHELAKYSDRVTLHMDDERKGHCNALAYLERVAHPSSHIYCCGPSSLMDAVGAACEQLGIPTRNFHTERFLAPPASTALVRPTHQDADVFTVVLARSGGRYVVPADKSLLEVLEEAGIAWPNSCREGLCGACEASVLAGTVHHRDYVLNEAQHAANGSMMICISRARGILNLDI